MSKLIRIHKGDIYIPHPKRAKSPRGKFTWTAQITVDKTWVADGFELTKETLQEMMEQRLGYAYSHEIKTKILAKPPALEIAKAQGFVLVDKKKGKK